MKKSIFRIALVALSLMVVLLGCTASLAENKTSATIEQGADGAVIKDDAFASYDPEHSNYPYIEERHKTLGEFDDWSLEDKAGFSEWMEEQGYPQDTVVNGLPGDDNMKAEDVVAQARQTVLDKYDIKDTVLDGMFKVQTTYNVIDPDAPLWIIEFRVKDGVDVNDLGYYRVEILDATGEIVEVYSIEDAQG